MKLKDQILLEQAYQTIFEQNKIALRKKESTIQDPEILRRMAEYLSTGAEFYANIQGLKSEEEEWSREKSTSKHIKIGSLQRVLQEVPNNVQELEQGGYDWTRVFISTHKVMDPRHENIGRPAQLTDITNTVTLINNRNHILVRAYDPYGVRPSKEMQIPKDSKTNIHNALIKAENLLMSLYQ